MNTDDKKEFFLSIKSMPFIKNFSSSKKLFFYCIILFFFTMSFALAHIYFQEKKTTNKILLSRESTLNSEITRFENKNDLLEAEILLLKDEVKSLSKKRDRKKLAKISKYLADSEMSGSGLIVTLADAPSDFLPVQDEKNIVHNTDLLKIVNFLWDNGADAISINGERIVQNTHISCIGPTILINKKRIISPFEISAIGENLKKNNLKNSSFVVSFSVRGIEFEIQEKPDISIPAGKYTTYTE